MLLRQVDHTGAEGKTAKIEQLMACPYRAAFESKRALTAAFAMGSDRRLAPKLRSHYMEPLTVPPEARCSPAEPSW